MTTQTDTAIEQLDALAEIAMQEQADADQVDAPVVAGRPIVPGPDEPIFLFDDEIARGPGYVQFGTLKRTATGGPVHEPHCMLQWGSALIRPGRTRVDFPRPFDSRVTSVVAGGVTREPGHPYAVTYDAEDLEGFCIHCEGYRVVSWISTGR